MKTSILCAALLAASALAAPAMAGDVAVTLDGVQARGGKLLMALQTRDQFLQAAGAYGEVVDNPQAGTRTVILRNVAPGAYSLSVLHDEDGDGAMKMDGYMPGEGWSMLNGAELRATPTFDQVDFEVPASGGRTEIRAAMIYPR